MTGRWRGRVWTYAPDGTSSAHEVLKEAREDFEVRAHRSLVLASEAADSDLAERWLAEEPGPEAALLWARVAMLRALRMADARRPRAEAPGADSAVGVRAGRAAAPEGPHPLGRPAGPGAPRPPQDPAPQGLLTAPTGPWYLFAHILRLDPWHREAHHRFLSFFFTRNGGSASARWDVAAFLSQRAPATSPLRLLPLVALVEDYDPTAAARRPHLGAAAVDHHRDGHLPATGFRGRPVTASRRCSTWPIWRMRCSWRSVNSRRGKSSRPWGPTPRACPGVRSAIPGSN